MKRIKPGDTPIPVDDTPAEVMDAPNETAPEEISVTAAPVEEKAAAEAVAPNEDAATVEAPDKTESVPAPQETEKPAEEEYSDEISALLAQFEGLMTPAESVDDLLARVDADAGDASTSQDFYQDETTEETFRYDRMHAPVAVADDEDEDFFDDPVVTRKERKKRSRILPILLLILLAALVFGGYYYYQNVYLIPISALDISTAEDVITVNVDTEADASLLRVVCTDPNGKAVAAGLTDGSAVFTGLASDSIYTIELTAEGFHRFEGTHSGTIITEQLVTVQDFTAITGTEDGSVILDFAFDGSNQDWVMEYSAEGEESSSVSFTGDSVTVSNLTVGKEYTFTLVAAPGSNTYISGNNTLVHTASNNILAQQLRVISFEDGILTAQWDSPDGAEVENWTVRCHNGRGYDETVTVTGNTVQFKNVNLDTGYTMDVTAAGMTGSARVFVSSNPTLVSEVTVNDTVPGTLTVTWNSDGVIPEGGWLLMYTLDNGKSSAVIKTDENKAVIQPTTPGSVYHLNIQAANDSTVFGGTHTYTSAAATAFNDKSINSANVTASFCPTPNKSSWTYKDIADDAYTSTYPPGSKVSMVLYSTSKAARSNDDISVMFVIRDSEGNALPQLTNSFTGNWNDLWNNRSRYCSLNLPAIPDADGQYTVEVYFNRSLVVTKTLNISAQ